MKNKILFLTSFPPRECGIATYSQDLISAIKNKFEYSNKILICALENDKEQHPYSTDVNYILNTDQEISYKKLAYQVNNNSEIALLIIQHEFGFFAKNENAFLEFLQEVNKPIILVFHTVLPQPNPRLFQHIRLMASHCQSIVVMTNTSAKILKEEYYIATEKIEVIPHGTHLVQHVDKSELKKKYNLEGKEILTTFGLLSSGKSIETTLMALPIIIQKHPETKFLVLGKTHPSVLLEEGEAYRDHLSSIIIKYNLQNYVEFVNEFLPLPTLLEYLQLTDIYLFTSKDPNQAVSGTFSYAISSGCAIVSTPIPHAKEVLHNAPECIIDFENSEMLSQAVIRLLGDKVYLKNRSEYGLHKMASTAWENTSIAYASLFNTLNPNETDLNYVVPKMSLMHIEKLTDEFGMLQFSKLNHPDRASGYTLDDNARALIAVCQYYQLTHDEKALPLIKIYYEFIKFCLQDEGDFYNYVDEHKNFTKQNFETNIEDPNGRAIWALGYLAQVCVEELPFGFITDLDEVFNNAMSNVRQIHSSRAMAFIIKGIYYYNIVNPTKSDKNLLIVLSNRLYNMFRHESNFEWNWFESYLTYANSVLSEAMLCAYLVTRKVEYKVVAKATFDFLLSKIFYSNKISVIKNVKWLLKGEVVDHSISGGEQPIDVAYTIMALEKFNAEFKEDGYNYKIQTAYNWFLGHNHLNQTVYNPCTGGCYDGLERFNVNLNQGAESTVSYLLSRTALERLRNNRNKKEQHVMAVLS